MDREKIIEELASKWNWDNATRNGMRELAIRVERGTLKLAEARMDALSQQSSTSMAVAAYIRASEELRRMASEVK